MAFSCGASILLTSNKLKYDRSYILKYFSADHYNATVLYTTPSLFLKWFPRHVENVSLRILTLGGEPFPRLNFESWPFLKNVELFNIYGVTEVSCWATISKVVDFENVTLGTPLTDTFLEVRNNECCVAKDGIGELYVGWWLNMCHNLWKGPTWSIQESEIWPFFEIRSKCLIFKFPLILIEKSLTFYILLTSIWLHILFLYKSLLFKDKDLLKDKVSYCKKKLSTF